MTEACSVPSPEEREAAEILAAAQRAMMEAVHAAIGEAAKQVRDRIDAAGLDLTPPPEDYFAAYVHQQIYLTLCGANADTFEGGDADTAVALIRNQQMIARHYWAATFAVTPDA